MRFGCPLPVWSALADDGLAGNEPGLGGIRLGLMQRCRDGVGVMAIDTRRVPAASGKARELVVAFRERGGPVNADVIIVAE